MNLKNLRFIGMLLLLLSINITTSYAEQINFRTIKSPDKGMIDDIVLPAHKGKIRFGTQLTPNPYPGPAAHVAPTRNASAYALIHTFKAGSSELQNDVLKADFAGDAYSSMGVSFSTAKPPSEHFKTWMPFLYKFALGTLSRNGLEHFFAIPATHPNQARWSNENWGGRGANQFARKRLFHEFVDSHLTQYQNWSKSSEFDESFYVVGAANLLPYDFTEKGLPMALHAVNAAAGIRASEAAKQKFTFPATKARRANYLKPMAEAKAQAIIAKTNRRKIYYVYEAKMNRARSTTPNSKLFTPIHAELTYDIVSKTLTIYADQMLTQELFSVDLK